MVSRSNAANEFAHAEALWSEQLLSDGYCIIPMVATEARMADIRLDLAADFAETPLCTGDFYGARTQRFGRLLIRSSHVASIVAHPTMLALAQLVFGPWCDTIQLNLTQAIAIHPGAPAQFPHRDQDMWRGDVGVREYLLNVIWPLDAFTFDNGATLIWPNSHGAAAGAPTPSEQPVVAACGPGDAIVFLGSTLHGAGANVSSTVRHGIIVSYCLGWLKPYENQWLAYPPEVARHFAPELAALVGYQQHRPNLGNYEGQCPSILLGDQVPDRLGAIDALRPDQQALLAEHMAHPGSEHGATA